MRKIFFYSLLITGLLISGNSFGQCKARDIMKGCKNDLKPFKYDAFVSNDINYTETAQLIEVEFGAMSGNEYRLVFCTSQLPIPVKITIYDKPKTNKKRKILYFDENSKDGFLCAFTPPKTGNYYIEYSVPAAKDKTKGCVVMIIGIK